MSVPFPGPILSEHFPDWLKTDFAISLDCCTEVYIFYTANKFNYQIKLPFKLICMYFKLENVGQHTD